MDPTNLFPTIGSKERLVDRVVNEIQNLIVEHKLEPGVRLPPERDLAEQIGVSRTVVREAVRILVAKGLLETTHGVGTVVRQVNSDQIAEHLQIMLQTRGFSLDHLHHVRSILEVEIAGMAALRATDEATQELDRILAEAEVVMSRPEAFADKDAEFHRLLAEVSRNPLLVMLLDSIRDLMREVRLSVSRHPDLFEMVIPDHRKILECVNNRDEDGARHAMQQHLEHARTIQERFLEQQSG